MTQQRLTPGSVTLSPDDWAAAVQVAKEVGGRGKSAGLRAVIAEWTKLGILVPELQRQIAELQQKIAVLEAR